MAMAYVYLTAAILFEVFGTIAMKYSEGFTKVIPIILTVVCHGICFVALAAALKSLPVSVAYSIWAGAGTAVIAVLGMLIFKEPLPLQKVLATGLIIIGVVMLNFTFESKKSVEPQLAKTEPVKVEVKASAPAVAIIAERNSG